MAVKQMTGKSLSLKMKIGVSDGGNNIFSTKTYSGLNITPEATYDDETDLWQFRMLYSALCDKLITECTITEKSELAL